MKVVLLLFAFGLAAGASNLRWEAGTEYIFRYDSQVLTGIPTTSTQYSGIKLICTVRCQLETPTKVIVKLEDITIKKVNDRVGIIPTEPIPESAFTPIPEEEARIFMEHLPEAISFSMEQGYISEVSAPAGEPYFITNIKKGIVNLFQVNMGQRSHLEDLSVHHRDYMSYGTATSSDNAFRVMEPGVCGTCESIYTIVPNIPSSGNAQEMFLNKVRNYVNCLKKPIWEAGMLASVGHGIRIGTDLEKSLLKAYTHTDYILEGDSTNFVIKKAACNSKFVFTPYREGSGSITAFILQQMELLKAIPSASPITPSAPLVPNPDGLLMTIPNPITDGPTPSPTPSNFQAVNKDRIQQVETLIESLISKTEGGMTMESSVVIGDLEIIMNECTQEELMIICNKYITSSRDRRTDLLLGILPALTTPEVVPVMVRLLKDDKITYPTIVPSIMIQKMAMTVIPSPAVITNLLTLCEDTTIRQRPMILRPAMLGLGTVMFKLTKLCNRMAIPKSVIVPALTKAVQGLEGMLEDTAFPREEIITILKAIGNSGLPDFMPILTKIINSNAGPKVIQTQAIYAMRRIATVVPRRVQEVLLPIYLDPRRPYEERIACALILLKSNPSLGVMQVIAHSLNRETSLQVHSFVYSLLRTLSTSTNPSIWKMAQKARLGLISARPVSVGYRYSKAYLMDFYGEKCDMGADVLLMKIMSPNGILPKAMASHVNLTMFGHNMEILELGIGAEGMETVLHKLVGPYGILQDIINKKSDIKDMLEPHLKPILGNVEEEMKRILKKIAIKERPMEEFRGGMFHKIFGHETNHYMLDRATIRSLEQSIMPMMDWRGGNRQVDLLLPLPTGINCLLMPTPIGIPISLNVSAHIAVRAKGTIGITGLPSIRDIILHGNIPDEIGISVDIRASLISQVENSLSVVTPPVTVGTAIRINNIAQKPINMESTIRLKDAQISVKYNPSKEEVMMYRVRRMPLTFTCLRPPTPIPQVCTWEEKEIVNKSIIMTEPTRNEIVLPLVSSMLVRECDICRPLAAWAPMAPLTGRHECRYTLKPTPTTVTEVNIQIIGRNQPGPGPTPPPTRGNRANADDSWFSWFNSDRRQALSDSSYAEPVVPDPVVGPNPRRRIYEMICTTNTQNAYKAKMDMLCARTRLAYQLNVQTAETTVMASGIRSDQTLIDIVFNLLAVRPGPSSVPERTPYIKLRLESGGSTRETDIIKWNVMTAAPRSSPVNYLMTANPDIPVYSFDSDLILTGPSTKLKSRVLVNTFMGLAFRNHVNVSLVSLPGVPTPPPGRATMKIHVAPVFSQAVVFMKTPDPIDLDFVITIPLMCPFMEPMELSLEPPLIPGPPSPFLSGWNSKSGECRVMEDRVVTYDMVTYPLPELSADCEVILSKDCGPMRAFAVLATLPRQTRQRSIKLLIPNKRVEVMPYAADMRILVDGERISLMSAEPYIIRERIGDPRSPVVIEMKKIDEKLIVICKQIGLTLIVSRNAIMIEPPSTLRSKTCGLCGDFNGETTDEYQGPDMSVYKRPEDMVRSYILPSRSCQIPPLFASDSSAEQSDICKAKKMTMIRFRDHKGKAETCFSTVAVPVCRGPCKTLGIRSEAIPFHCMPSGTPDTKQLEKKARRTALKELANKEVHMRDYINTQEQCVPSLF